MWVRVRIFLSLLCWCFCVQASQNNDFDLKLQNLETFLLERISNLESVVTKQNDEIANLRQEMAVLRLQTNTNAKETSKLRTILLRNRNIQNQQTNETPLVTRDEPNNILRIKGNNQAQTMSKGRRLLMNGGGGSRVAFYAYLSADEAIQKHKTLIFDVIKSNFGRGYNNFTGTFTAPTSGVYVLTFTIHPEGTAFASVQLVVNKEVEGAVFADSSSADVDITGVTAIMVVWMNQGDVAFVRTHPTYGSTGSLYSTQYGRCSFAGWLLSD